MVSLWFRSFYRIRIEPTKFFFSHYARLLHLCFLQITSFIYSVPSIAIEPNSTKRETPLGRPRSKNLFERTWLSIQPFIQPLKWDRKSNFVAKKPIVEELGFNEWFNCVKIMNDKKMSLYLMLIALLYRYMHILSMIVPKTKKRNEFSWIRVSEIELEPKPLFWIFQFQLFNIIFTLRSS